MSKRDYYEVLGVDRGADAGVVKSAFRKKAGAHHPDRHPTASDTERKEHEEKFKEAAEAYEVLSDDQKRAAYDRFGHEGVQSGGGGFQDMGDVFGDLFEGFFGGGGNSGGAKRGGDMRVELLLDFEEAAFGYEKEIDIHGLQSCKRCDGEGSEEGTHRRTCSTCGGQGRVRVNQGFFSVATACRDCHGEGEILDKPCKDCSGLGRRQGSRKIKVKIPAGVDEGNQIRVRGEGEPGSRGGPGGDLYVLIRVRPHSIFEREGTDLRCRVPITFAQAALGDKVDVPTLEGKNSLKIPAGTQSGHVFRLRNQGIADVNGRGRGDLLAQIHVETPVHLSSRQKELLREFGELSDEDSSPQLANFFKKAKKLFK